MLIDNSSKLPDGSDLFTKEGWEEHMEFELEWAHGCAKEQELRHRVILLCEVNPRTQEALLQPMPVVMIPIMDDEDEKNQKDLFVQTCKAVALLGRAVACISVAEAWISTGHATDVNNPNRPRPRDDPNRIEALVVIAEHRDFGSHLHTATITHDQGTRVISDWECKTKQTDAPLQGRMTGFVPPLDVYDHPAIKPVLDAATQLLGVDEVR